MTGFEQIIHDVRYAARTLRRSPGFAGAAVVTLALGIGANTAIFSTIDEALLRPLPLPDAGQLAQIYSFDKAKQTYVSSSYPDYEDFAKHSRTFQQISAYVRVPLRVAIGDRTGLVATESVTVNYFDMLRLPALRGRVFEARDAAPGAEPVAMIGENFWRRRLGADPAILGKLLLIEDRGVRIVGIVPGRYRGANLNWGQPPEIWLPLQKTAELFVFRGLDVFNRRGIRWLVLIGRLKRGATVGEAQAELQTLAGAAARAEPATNGDLTAVVFAASHAKFWPAYRSSVTRSLAVFAIAAGLVLLVACANVSNLMLDRALSRRREFAVRLAVGAGRGRLVRQLLTESLLLAAPGVALALGAAAALERVMGHFPAALGLPLALEVGIESRTLLFSVGVAVAVCLLVGLTPAIQAARPDVMPALKSSGEAGDGRRPGWQQRALVGAQVGFSMILLVAGGEFGRSVLKGYSTDLGFRSAGLLTAEFTIPQGAEGGSRFLQTQQALVERLERLPGIAGATLASEDLLSPVHSTARVGRPGGAETVEADRDAIGAGYLATTGIALVGGREFTERDDAQAPAVAIVNRVLAGRLWPGGDALGRTIAIAGGRGKAAEYRVVGVAAAAKYRSVWEEPQPYVYLAAAQSGYAANYLMVRTRGGERDAAEQVRGEWERLAPRAPFAQLRTVEQVVEAALGPQRMALAILAAFGLLAIVLAGVGVYSVMAYSVRRRRREIGIRMALGAGRRAVIGQVVGESMKMAAVGAAAGAGAGAALMRMAASQIRGVAPFDGGTFLAVGVVLGVVTAGAALIPARRAAGLDPARALRAE